jgi:hypothetical protein
MKINDGEPNQNSGWQCGGKDKAHDNQGWFETVGPHNPDNQ